jgi:hypothetical protein
VATQDYYYSNTAVAGTVGNTGGISNSATSLYLTSTPSGYPSQYPFKLTFSPNGSVNQGQAAEVVKVTAGAGTAATPWTIVRGWDGTTAAAWAQNASVQHQITAEDETLASLHRGSVQADLPHGLPSAAWQAAPLASISRQLLTAAAGTVTFSSIPASYSTLMLVVQARGSETTAQADDITCTVNGDAGAYYSYLTFSATNISGSGTGALGAVADATGSAAANWPLLRINTAQAGGAANAGGGIAWFPNYANATFGKMFWSMSGAGNGSSAMVSGVTRMGWYTPAAQAAITSLTLTAPGGGSNTFLAGSYFQLLGMG